MPSDDRDDRDDADLALDESDDLIVRPEEYREDDVPEFESGHLWRRLSTIVVGLFFWEQARLAELLLRWPEMYWKHANSEFWRNQPVSDPLVLHGFMLVLSVVLVLFVWEDVIRAYYSLPDEPPVERDEW